jgi:hypothetical protein
MAVLVAVGFLSWMPAPEAYAQGEGRSDCSATHDAAQRKMEQERKKEEERHQQSYPDQEATNDEFQKCLDGIYNVNLPNIDFPTIPDFSDVVNGICKEVRRKVQERVNQAVGGVTSEVNRGLNSVKPPNGRLNQDIWDVLQ